MSIIFHGENPVWDPYYGGPPPIRVMSTFSGIGAASISWHANETVLLEEEKVPLFDFVAYAEIEPFPCHVLHYRRGTSRPKYMPDPFEEGITDKESKTRKARIKDVSHLPEAGIVNFGDITQITDEDLRRLGHVDVLEGGSPCQAFSVAGERQGLNDARGNLLLAFCRLAERMREINGLRYVVWENVHGVLSDKTNGFGCLLASLAGEQEGPLQPPGRRWTNAGRVLGPEGRRVAWRTIQASHWGVPQRRKRIFVVANLGAAFDGVGTAREVLFEFENSFWHPQQGLKTRQAVVATYRSGNRFEYRSAEERYRDPEVLGRLETEASKGWIGTGLTGGSETFAIDMKSQPYSSETAYALTAQNEGNPPVVAYALADDYFPKASKDTAFALMAGSRSGGGHKQMVVHPETAGTLCASGAGTARAAGMASETDFVVVTKPVPRQVIVSPPQSGTLYAREAQPIGVSSEHNFVVITKDEGDENPENWVVRRFTPLECERLQGFPDYWTDVPFKGKLVTDGHRYKAIGNSMACPVMAYIGYHLELAIDMQDTFEDHPEWWREVEKKRGRPPENGVAAMSAAERQRRRRERLRQAALSEEST
ncbi:MAG: DNA (cytosine-5-)-methyltransferase [Mesorhizobium sp.]